ncbi:MAG: type 1 glutamine amidotransferase domain-containing protein [Nocardioides sp.]|uniref:type 1 glutamine amidotransferase domain-containing protein n=1 Tax=Nocardioides sp. TaxID=35761 RepID=UPI0039E2E6DB
MPRVAFLVSSARAIDLDDDPQHPTGYWAEEVLTSYERLMAVGVDTIVMTVDGTAPSVDPYSLDPVFHQPLEDRGYFASVHRTFHRDPDDVRITLHHTTELDLAAGRRIARRMVLAGRTAEEAHRIVSTAAKIAWREDRRLVEVMATEGIDGGVPEGGLREAVAELDLVCRAMAEDRAASLVEIEELHHPVALQDLDDADLAAFDGMFVPGGHAAMVDLPESPAVGRLVASLHGRGAPIAALCHGPAALLAAPDRWDGQWLFEGYRFTSFTDDEESQNAIGRGGLPWRLAPALQNAGGILDDAAQPWASHVVVDRNLITGQNPFSTRATVGALLKALGLAGPRHRSR